MSAMNDALTTAFQLLASVVQNFATSGRVCLGATLKPILYTQGRFSEQLLGFQKFGDFLRAAQAAGYVSLTPTPGGDIRISPSGNPVTAGTQIPTQVPLPLIGVPPSPVDSTAGNPIRIRQDLWDAFNSFSVKWVYDPTADIAYRESDVGTRWHSPGVLVQIPLARDRVLEWMRSFANVQDEQTKAQLFAILDTETGLYQFRDVVRSKGLLRLWSRFHVQHALSAIDAWAASNNVRPKNVATPFYWARPQPFPAQIASSGAPVTAVPEVAKEKEWTVPSPLTGRLESLIDDLIDELIRLRGLLQVARPKT
jgi:hypothetical protein